jgi:hypothetical protein
LVFAIGSTTGFDDGALGSFHGSRRVTQFLQWAAPFPLVRVTRAERRELRFAVSSAAGSGPAIEGGSARSSNSACCRWRAVSTRPLSRSWLHTFRSFTTPRSLFNCLFDRFGKPLRRFNALAPLDERLSGSQRNAIARTRAQVCFVLDSWLRHYASDFLADSELFADSRSCWWQRADVCRLVRSLAPRVAGRDGAAVSPQAAGVRGADQENAQVLRRRARSKSRTLLDYHPVEVARQMALAAGADFCARATERADVARLDVRRARAQLPEHQRIINQCSTASAAGWRRKYCASPTTRRCASACSSARFIELAHCCRDVQNLHARMYAVYVGLNQWAVQRLKGLWEKLLTKWEKRCAELDKSNSAAIRALLRCEHEVGVARCAPPQLEQETPRGRRAALGASLPARRVLFRAANAEIYRFLWHAREPFDDAQLTALSNLCEPSSLAAANAVDSDAVLAPLRPPALPTQGRARVGSVSSRLSTVFRRTTSKPATPTPSSPAAVATAAGGSPSLFRVTLPSSTTSRARAAAPRLDARASATQRHRARRCRQAGRPRDRAAAAQGARSQERCRVGAREDAAAATAAKQ